ncbi:MAG TPA: sodium:proton exchanger [Bacteroidales bacterium]|nr:sodium:proton exchanger [Bacteroidales bacterium]HBZ19711.1 sodium:proton exchanger [Bacteroidales bacterium]
MSNLFLYILGFATCAGIIIYSGTKLSFYGHKIADLTGMGKAWVGLILMASVTSLPELITGISSVVIIKEPDFAAGDIFGSCIFNLLILTILDARLKQSLFSVVKSDHIVGAIFGIILLTVAGIALSQSHVIPSVLWISSSSFALFGVYLIAVRSIYKYEFAAFDESQPHTKLQSPSRSAELKKTITGYAIYAFIVIAAAVFLPYFGEHIASSTGLSNSFFGTLFLAASTSLPELVVSLSALKMGSADMAVGNLLGSNVFNVFILGFDDIFYTEGSIFKDISPSHSISIYVTIIMTAVVVLGLLFKIKKKQAWNLSINSFIIIVLYLALMVFLFIKK